MTAMQDKLRAIIQAHPPGVRMVSGTGYGATGTGPGTGTGASKAAYKRQYYQDNKKNILAAQSKKRVQDKAQAARDLTALRKRKGAR